MVATIGSLARLWIRCIHKLRPIPLLNKTVSSHLNNVEIAADNPDRFLAHIDGVLEDLVVLVVIMAVA